ncbi:MAG: STAS domain-containing protein, partial [Phycisphaerae bacterium]|nr:STAS domain-containing protein [Phycisphaerae bacterium]
MKITEESYGQDAILVCNGELTEDSLDAFRHAVEQIEHRNNEGSDQSDAVADLVLDFEAVPFIDSAG